MDLLKQKMYDAQEAQASLTGIVKSDQEAVDAQAKGTQNAQAAYQGAVDALNAYEQSLKGATDKTLAQKDRETELKQAVDTSNAAHATAAATYNALDATLTKHQAALDKEKDAVTATTNAYQEASAAAARADQDYYDAQAVRVAQSVQLIGASNAQKVKLYQQYAAEQDASSESGRQKERDYETQSLNAYLAMLGDESKAHEEFIKKLQDSEANWISDLTTHTKSLKDVFSDVWKSIEDGYVQMIANMAAGSLFKGLNETIFKGVDGPGGTTAGSGWLGAVTGLGGTPGTGINSVVLDHGAVPVYLKDTGPSANYNLTGSSSGIPGTTTPSTTSPSASGSGSAQLSFLQRSIANIAEGVATSGLVSSLTGGNSGNAAIGGAIGGGALSLLTGGAATFLKANPLVGFGVDALTSLIGSIINPPKSAAHYPDQNDATYAQAVSDINGIAGRFGNNFVAPDQQYSSNAGGTPLDVLMAQFVQTHQSDVKDLTVSQQNLYNQILKLMGGNANASGQSTLDVTGEKGGAVTLGSGQKLSATDLDALFTNFTQNAASISAATPVYKISRGLPDYNLSTAAANGVYDQSALGNQQSGSGASIPGQPTVTINAQGSNFVGTGGIAQTAQLVSNALASINRGSLPGLRVSLTAANRTTV